MPNAWVKTRNLETIMRNGGKAMGIILPISGDSMDKRLLMPILISFILPVPVLVLLNYGMTAGTPLYVMIEIGFILLLPATPLIYGWLASDIRGAIIIGTFPIILVTLVGAALNPTSLFLSGRICQVAIFLVPLTLIGGLIGLFSSRQGYTWLCLAIGLTFVWVVYFLLAGIN